ncbi:MAG: AAA family ATPase [Candidatus Lokiarchaeota archaeon]|nr:AAA family ATPase [Candidatus Harpocratesius repetitus]
MSSSKINIMSEEDSPIWRIKYRPKKLSEIKNLFPKLYEQLKGFIQSNNFPHLMLIGPPGSGKTMIGELIAREILGKEFTMNSKILYADDPIGKAERNESKRQGRVSSKMLGSGAGSQKNFRPFIQIRVRPFVSTKKFGKSPFKILIIKNFHDLDVEQQGFRRIMERYSRNCRMILITDRISSIIDPIVSRCQLLLVPYLPDFKFNKLIKTICDQEKIPIKLDVIEYIRHMSEKNIGKALDLLQITKIKYNELSLDSLSKVYSMITDRGILNLISLTMQGDVKSLRTKVRSIFQNQNLSKDEILFEMSKRIADMPLEPHVQALYLELIANTDFGALDSQSDEIQLLNLLIQMNMIGKMNFN